MVRGYPLPSRLGDLGSVVSSPSGVRGGGPAENGFWCILSFKKEIGVMTSSIFFSFAGAGGRP